MNFSAKADMNLTLDGSMQAEVTSGLKLTLKSGFVFIN